MADNAARADEFRKQAEKKMKALGWFGGGSKWEDAAELWEKAANNYKLAKCWKEAAEAYEKLADCHMKLESKHEAAGCYVDAAKAASKVDPKRSKALLQLAVGLYTDMGRLNMAARQLKQIAEELEKSGAKEESITYYEQAADLFETENSDSEATKCKLKIAEFTAEAGKYSKAVELYEAAARRAVDNNLLKFSARGYLLNAGVCLFCYASLDEIERRIDKYKDIDLQFGGSREAMLMEQLLEAFQNENETEFATALADFDSVIRLDAWKTKILLVAKRRLGDISLGVKGAAGDEEDEDDDVL